MSYILDALKKSDRERPRAAEGIPLHEVPAFRTRPRSSGRAARAAGIAMLILGAVAGGAWMARQGGGSPAAVLESVPIPPDVAANRDSAAARALPADGSAVTPVADRPGVSTPGAGQEAPTSAATAAAPAMPASSTREGLLELWQLTEAEQKYLQGLDVSFHVHSNDPSKRAVIINGLRAREGQSLGEDLRLDEIVPDGIVLEFQGQFVHLANPQPY